MKLKNIAMCCYNISKDHGWWNGCPKNGEKGFYEFVASKLMLIVSEVVEALEEVRTQKDLSKTYYSKVKDTGAKIYCSDKPEGVPSELADVVIRVFDLCGYLNIDIEKAIKEKMNYNSIRSYKHGGKKL